MDRLEVLQSAAGRASFKGALIGRPRVEQHWRYRRKGTRRTSYSRVERSDKPPQLGLFLSLFLISFTSGFFLYPAIVVGWKHRTADPGRTVGQVDGHVDWLTWTMRPPRQPENIQEVYHIARRLLKGLSHEHEEFAFDGQGFDRSIRVSNFDLCLSREDQGFRLGGGGPTGYFLFDASGRACDSIRDPALSRRIVSEIRGLLTRFDYAVDIRTGTLPSEFANTRSHQAFRSVSFIRSDTGETVYVGSRKSDRFARVYRYNPPHPRADLLRVEYVFRRGMAAAAAEQYCEQDNDAHFLARLGNTWGWSHKDWNARSRTDERIEAPTVDRHTEDTIAWLYKQVVPAMARVLRSGGFDMADFLEKVYNQNP